MLSKPMGEDLKLRNGIGFYAVILSEAKNPCI